MQTYISIGQVSKILGISLSTIYRWEKLGKLISCFRTIGNHRRFKLTDIHKISNQNENSHKKVIAYARVSTHKQKNDLENKKQFLNQYCINQNIFNIKIIILNNDIQKSSEQEFSEDLCEIITVFSARLYGKRSHKNKITS